VSASTRRHDPLARWLASLLVVCWLAPLAAPHAADDDLLCVPLPGASGAAAALTAASDADRPHHCVICHNLRSHRSAFIDCGAAGLSLAPEHAVSALLGSWHRAPAFDRLPARAPPA
jgi:hypothetical protein